MTKRLLLAIEGGATRTTGVVTDEGLRVLARRELAGSNIHAVGRARARMVVWELVEGALADLGIGAGEIAAAALCVAGIRSEADRKVWRRIVRKTARLRCPVALTHDAAAALAAGSADETGAVVICGTGSLVYARRADGSERLVGGRGPILGDEGSGFDIGRQGLRAAIRSADGRGPKTLLESLIPQRLKLSGLDDLVPWVSPFAKDRVAGVARIVFEAARGGDAAARGIIQAAADELAHSVEVAATQLWGSPERLPRVVFHGGVLRHQPVLRKALAAAIRRFAPAARRALPRLEAVLGAARLARRLLAGG